jgi:hypothetical protein
VPVPVETRFKAQVCGLPPAEIMGSNSTSGMEVCCECCVLLGRGLCDGLITSIEESYRPWCVVVYNLETSQMRRLLSTGGGSVAPKTDKVLFVLYHPKPARSIYIVMRCSAQYRNNFCWHIGMCVFHKLLSKHFCLIRVKNICLWLKAYCIIIIPENSSTVAK